MQVNGWLNEIPTSIQTKLINSLEDTGDIIVKHNNSVQVSSNMTKKDDTHHTVILSSTTGWNDFKYLSAAEILTKGIEYMNVYFGHWHTDTMSNPNISNW